jgi:repressor LexA
MGKIRTSDIMLEYIRQYIREHEYPPSIREIQGGCGISSTSVVSYNLNILERQGKITRDKHKARAIVVIDDN